MRIFVDTSAFYALLDRDDENHPKGEKAWDRIIHPENTLVTSNYVLVETFALLQKRLGFGAVRGFQEDMIPILQVEFITSDIHRLGVAALLSASRRGFSLVDCISFEVMRDWGIKTAFTFDPHFREQGFQVIP
jgi:predicted nucleic acid-binding protein